MIELSSNNETLNVGKEWMTKVMEVALNPIEHLSEPFDIAFNLGLDRNTLEGVASVCYKATHPSKRDMVAGYLKEKFDLPTAGITIEAPDSGETAFIVTARRKTQKEAAQTLLNFVQQHSYE